MNRENTKIGRQLCCVANAAPDGRTLGMIPPVVVVLICEVNELQ